MTEELENKLNELLGMKKQIEELTAEKKMSDDTLLQEYKKQGAISKIICKTSCAIGAVILLVGLIAMTFGKLGEHQILSLFSALLGYMIVIDGDIKFHITQSKLTILQEMKQFELRLTEMLKK